MQQERQQTLEKLGISVEASGISVEKNKYYLVNLNADPCLNEMLVYYLKVRILNLGIYLPLEGGGGVKKLWIDYCRSGGM